MSRSSPPDYQYPWPSKRRYWTRSRRHHADQREIEGMTLSGSWWCGCHNSQHPATVYCRTCQTCAPNPGRSSNVGDVVFGKPIFGLSGGSGQWFPEGMLAVYAEARIGETVGRAAIRIGDGWHPGNTELMPLFSVLGRMLALDAAAGGDGEGDFSPLVRTILDRALSVTVAWIRENDPRAAAELAAMLSKGAP